MHNLKVQMRNDGSAVVNGTVIPAETLDAARKVGAEWRLDDASTMVFARQLEVLKSKAFRKKHTALKWRDLVDVSNEGGNAASSIKYRMWDAYGMAKIVSKATTDIPMVTASAQEFEAKYHSIVAGYEVTMQDAREAARTGVDLSGELSLAARRVIEQGLDEVAARGVPAAGTFGLVNNPNVPVVVLPNGDWANATTDEILADLNAFVQSVIDASGQHWEPDTILMDTSSFARIGQKIIGSDFNTTVVRAFLQNNPYIKNIDQWKPLNTAGADGGPRIMVYRRDSEALEAEVGQEFEVFPPQLDGFVSKVPCHARAAGVIFRHPLSAAYSDSIG